jgi:hypothetical protein
VFAFKSQETKTMPGIQADRAFCWDYAQREAYSVDFLLCEGYNGWAATHMMSFFTLMIFVGQVAPTWVFAALLECFEALMIAAFGMQWLVSQGYTSVLSLETLSGAILGDWLINDFFGILAAWLLFRLLNVPGLLSPWFAPHWPERGNQKPPPIWRSTLWWKQFGAAAFLMALFILPVFVAPAGCDQVPGNYTCWNVGLIALAATTLVFILVSALWTMRSPDHERYFWNVAKVSPRRRNAFFAFWALYIFLVAFQNTHPSVLFFVPLIAEWAQCWLAGLVWIFALCIYARYYAYAKEE